ncbi:MAG TPA: Spo0B domain-containing protein [Syntrophomonadaceae bacterium]|jgi:stage 0 sporulation protein B (sporulation initiation phosphotransferase)|nr:Spo0B domain-containing protein [Syntrophomonadaceae bacterium]
MNGEQVIQLLRQLRHDFGNHLQVISGYLDLGRSAEVKRYIQSLAEEMGEERIIFETCSPDTAFYFYQQLLLARERGIKMRYQDLSVSSVAALEKNQEPLKSVIKAAASAGDGRITVSVHQSEDSGILLYISTEAEPEPIVVSVME